MADLILKFTDEQGIRRAVSVTTERFSIGRTPDNDLTVASKALSRKHAEIRRFADVFIITDNDSSNGTKLNGQELIEPAALRDGDQLTLGGAIEIMIEMSGQEAANSLNQTNNAGSSYSTENNFRQNRNAAVPIWQNVYYIGTAFVAIFVLLSGILILILSNGQPSTPPINREAFDDPPQTNHHRSSRNRNSLESNDDTEPPVNRQTAENNSESANDNSTIEAFNKNANSAVASGNGSSSSEDEKVEGLALQFLRRISDNQNPVLNSEQIALIKAKIQFLKKSSAFRDNLKTANKNLQSFDKAGQTHNLKGAFLAAAALTKLNDARGDAAETATTIAPDLQKYAAVLGTELANDNLLAIAAYAEGNPPNAMRDRVANLTLTPGATAATVRTIWFLHDKGKISESAFDFAVRFIAAGTILQNPSAFNF